MYHYNVKHYFMKNLFLFLLLIFPTFSIFSQQIITGKVTDAQTDEPLIGVNVIVKGTPSTGTITDHNGDYRLEVLENSVLQFSFIGFKSEEILVSGRTVINVSLREDTELLDELVVIGYGSMRKSDLTGSVSSVSAEDMTQFIVSNPVQALQGRVPGVFISTNTGDPNANFNIRIRGVNSIRGDNSPLYIIDGIPSDVGSVNTYDIKSVEILKDASATAIYGSRGANGVILITTNKGETGKTTVNYNVEFGRQSLIRKLDMGDASEYMKLINIQQMNDKGAAYFTESQIASAGKGYDWQDAVFQNAPIQTHSLSVSGGTQNTTYHLSASALIRDGIIKNSSYRRFNVRSNIEHSINEKFDISLLMSYNHTERKRQSSGFGNRGGSLIGASLFSPPTLTPYDENGEYYNLQLAYPFMSNAIYNAINIVNETSNVTVPNLTNINTAITYKPFNGFSLRSSFGLENNDYRTDNYTRSKYLYSSNAASVSTYNGVSLINENIANYNFKLNDAHSFNIMGGFTYQQHVSKSLGASGSGFLSDVTESFNLQAAENPGIPNSSYSKWVLMSYLARLNYSYKGKYMATTSFRSDGSSRYSEGSKWSTFPSFALAWRISQENFMKKFESLSDLKFRLGYGETGSTAISPYATLNTLASGTVPLSGSLYPYFAPSLNYPGALRWETTAQWNIGLDLALFDSKLRITADYYNKITYDLLNSVNLPLSSGYSQTIMNVGEMSNKGFELLVEGDIINKKDFSWNVSANIATNKNEVVKLYDGKEFYGSNVGLVFVNGTVNLIREGEPIGVYYVFKEDGYDENGRIQHVDVDGDGNLTNEDRFILGSPHPDFTYGLNTYLRYKNFDLSLFFQGVYGNEIYNISEAQNLDYGMGLNLRRDVLYSHWDATNSDEVNQQMKYPKITQNQPLEQSDRYIEDGSYLRLKNITLSYNLPVKKLNLESLLSNLKIFVSVQNALTFTKYSGWDPEVNSYGGDITTGIDYLTYPNNKSLTFGMNIQF